jgi:hypothetical protein
MRDWRKWFSHLPLDIIKNFQSCVVIADYLTN